MRKYKKNDNIIETKENYNLQDNSVTKLEENSKLFELQANSLTP